MRIPPFALDYVQTPHSACFGRWKIRSYFLAFEQGPDCWVFVLEVGGYDGVFLRICHFGFGQGRKLVQVRFGWFYEFAWGFYEFYGFELVGWSCPHVAFGAVDVYWGFYVELGLALGYFERWDAGMDWVWRVGWATATAWWTIEFVRVELPAGFLTLYDRFYLSLWRFFFSL